MKFSPRVPNYDLLFYRIFFPSAIWTIRGNGVLPSWVPVHAFNFYPKAGAALLELTGGIFQPSARNSAAYLIYRQWILPDDIFIIC